MVSLSLECNSWSCDVYVPSGYHPMVEWCWCSPAAKTDSNRGDTMGGTEMKV